MKPYRKWVGVLLAFTIAGSAHFLSGKRSTGIKWFFGLFACNFVPMVILAMPGILPIVISIAVMLTGILLWFVMLKQSYRPVRRIGFWGWIAVLILTIAMNHAQIFVIRQFVWPFKVPTGAMQPTIFGVHGYDMPPDSLDRPSIIQNIFSGQRYYEAVTVADGILSLPKPSPTPYLWIYNVGSQPYELPRFVTPSKKPGEHISAGETLWSGVTVAGDHIFTDRFSYRFSKPKRGDIAVFKTDGIKLLQQNNFYIMRIAGIPGDRISIAPPFLKINGQKVLEPEIFATISSESGGHSGFNFGGKLTASELEWVMDEDEYFVLGDNTTNSRDSRYWGPVPAKNIIGKVTRIYWPFTRINAL